jgi:feruloyl esterase
MNRNPILRCLVPFVAAIVVPSSVFGATCETLSSAPVPNGAATLAASVAAGAFTPPAGAGGRAGGANPFARLGPFCRVAATLRPGPESDVKMEVWLPSSGWNGKLQVVGNGGFAGTISYPAMATALAAGYAAASTDTGHTGPSSNTFANDDALLDFAHRAIHATAAAAKKIVDGFYGQAPKFSYFNGCSTGGRQALTAAQRYPDDFDGIVAGAPASHTSTQAFGQIWVYQATANPAAALPGDKLALVNSAVLAACDARDGAADGVIENPLSCAFDPQVLACKEGGDSTACLTGPQVEAVQRIYAGASNPRTGQPIFPGLERGSERGWAPTPVGYAVDYFKYIVFKDPNWDPKTLNFDSHVAQAARPENLIFDATNADLTRFTVRGGKLLMYQGWAEPGIPPRNIVRYYDDVQQKTQSATQSVRLFMVPGMGHCGGGNGTSTFDMVAALDRWKETGAAPDRIAASRVRDGKVDRTRPLCAWPQVAVFRGSGSIDDAANFECRAPQ